MTREPLVPRPGWQAEMKALGFTYHSIGEDGAAGGAAGGATGGATYWDESRCYRFSPREIDELEAATAELHEMSRNAAQHVVATGRFEEFAIPRDWRPRVAESWQAHVEGRVEGATLFGRMDLSYDGAGPPKLLEYNADTPTACLEAAVAQWHWLNACRPEADQFNSIHEKLIVAWENLRARSAARLLHFAAVEGHAEDWGNVNYLRDTATQAGWSTIALPVERIGFNGRDFVDEFNVPVELLFKLYPWEWLVRETFGPALNAALAAGRLQLVEPPWKMLLSNKALLVVLWELYPGHPNLLPAFHEAAPLGSRYVRKPRLAREGANVTWVDGAHVESTGGDYGAEGSVYQALAPLPRFGTDHLLVGSWVVDGAPAGIGLREDASPITRNTSRFVPHYFAG
jgi:glutathionylspermidine synthase